MKICRALVLLAALVIASAGATYADSSGRIHGKVTTVDGDTYEGLIRWDKNEGSWFDILNGDKEIRGGHRKQRRETIRVFGIVVGERVSSGDRGSAQSGLSFGHIESLQVLDDNSARLILKSGQKIVLEGGSSDIGDDIRELVIEDNKRGEIELDWDDIEIVEFSQGAAGLKSEFGERLYGTLTTRLGDEYTGWLSWDVDELFTDDILDGEERNRDRKVKLGRLESIERNSSSSAELVFRDGDKMVLRGTNDVNSSNRGISVYDTGVGQVTVDWSDFDRFDFKKPAEPLEYASFDGGRPLEGTAYTRDGESFTGTIRWDDDETHTWEILDGNYRGAAFDIEFGKIKEIERRGYRGANVTTWDGRTFLLSGSNDVNRNNRGIYVETKSGREKRIDWDDFDRVEFAR